MGAGSVGSSALQTLRRVSISSMAFGRCRPHATSHKRVPELAVIGWDGLPSPVEDGAVRGLKAAIGDAPRSERASQSGCGDVQGGLSGVLEWAVQERDTGSEGVEG